MKPLGEFHANTEKVLNSELWHACAGPSVSLPQPGSLVYYFPQGHSEQVSNSTRRIINSQIPSYPNLPSQLMCQVHNVTLHADRDSDEIYVRMTLQPVNTEADVFQIPDFEYTKSTQPTKFFCKNLTASDTSTHGGFSVPRRAAEKLFPQLDYTMQPPNQELIVRDLHDNIWTFRHIYRGQPKRHLLTTGWSLFVGAKRLKAGDSVLYIRDEKTQLLLGLRRPNCQQTAFPSYVLSADSMHIGVLAAAAHAVASNTPFTVYYNPRACPSEFIIPLSKYHKAAFIQVSVGMRFGMMFATEESIKRRSMGTIVGINDFDSLRWPNSKWRNLQVEWDEPSSDERPDRVSIWEIETPESLLVVPPSLKRHCIPGFMDVAAGNVKHYVQASDYRSGNLLSLKSNLYSEHIMLMLRKQPRTLPGSEIGFHQSVYATILHNIKANGLSATSSSTLPPLLTTQGALLHEEKLIESVKSEKKIPLFPLEQALTLEETSFDYKNTYHCLEKQGLLMETKLESQFSAENSWRNYLERNELDNSCEYILVKEKTMDKKSETLSDGENNGRMELTQNKVKTTDLLYPECLTQVTGNFERSSIVTLSRNEIIKNENFRNSVVPENNEFQASRPDDPLIYQLQHEKSFGLSQCIETANLLNKKILLNSLANQGCQLYHHSDNEELILQPSLQSFADPLMSPDIFINSSRPDNLFESAVENSASPSAGISPILNLEDLNPFETSHISSSLYSFTPTFMPILLEEAYDSQEISSSEGMPISGILSSHAQNVKSVIKESPELMKTCRLRQLSNEGNNPSEACSNLHSESSNANIFTVSSVPSTVIEEFSEVEGSSLHVPLGDQFGFFATNQDIQSQVTSTSIAESHAFSLRDIPDSSGGASSGNFDANDCDYFGKLAMKQVVQLPMRTYTKVQKHGSVGRSIDLKRFRNYEQLKSVIACMFGLEGQLDDPKHLEWKLVYVDQENDVLLVGDDPWDEFVNCVRCIRILSPSEVEQMSKEGLQFINSHQP